jgi:RNA 2',3'-cyclic 3'-phosphodiesterase
MNNLRLFVAIELPANALDALNRLQHELQRDPALARLRWVRPEGIHLTLKFLGAVPADKQRDMEAAVGRSVAGVPPFELTLGKLGTFGSKRSPRVLWIDVTGDTQPLARLQSQVEREFAALRFATESRPFAPHLTLARVPEERAREVADPLANAVASHQPPRATIRAEELALMKSDLRPGGAVYTQLFAARLG